MRTLSKSLPAVVAALAIAAPVARAQQVVYSNIPTPLAGNYPSVGYEATQTNEFGDRVSLAPNTPRYLSSATLVMSTWALAQDYPALAAADPTGWSHPFTLTLYDVGAGGAVGPVLWSQTVSQHVPWRPVTDPTCGPSSNPAGGWRAGDGNCYSGMAFTMNFAIGATVPNSFIYGLAYNTQTSGYSPIGAPGPYNSLNFAVRFNSTSSVGSEDPDEVYDSYGAADGGVPFSRDSFGGSLPNYTPLSQFTATPEPASLVLFGTGALALVGVARRRRRA